MAYPGLILANAARMAGVDARLFFTFWGLDIVNEKKIDHLHLNLVGNPSAPIPAMIACARHARAYALSSPPPSRCSGTSRTRPGSSSS